LDHKVFTLIILENIGKDVETIHHGPSTSFPWVYLVTVGRRQADLDHLKHVQL
jgi:hypothetical protein